MEVLVRKSLALVAVLLLAGGTMAADAIPGLGISVSQNSGVRHVAPRLPLQDDGIPPVPLPTPVEPGAGGFGFGVDATRGPVGGINAVAPSGGNGFLAPAGGGAFMTPEQRAERQIRNLVKKLG